MNPEVPNPIVLPPLRPLSSPNQERGNLPSLREILNIESATPAAPASPAPAPASPAPAPAPPAATAVVEPGISSPPRTPTPSELEKKKEKKPRTPTPKISSVEKGLKKDFDAFLWLSAGPKPGFHYFNCKTKGCPAKKKFDFTKKLTYYLGEHIDSSCGLLTPLASKNEVQLLAEAGLSAYPALRKLAAKEGEGSKMEKEPGVVFSQQDVENVMRQQVSPSE